MKLVNIVEQNEFSDLDAQDTDDADKTTAWLHRIDMLRQREQNLKDAFKARTISNHDYEQQMVTLTNTKQRYKLTDFYVGKYKIQNPIAFCHYSLYVGSPQNYPDLTTTQQAIYLNLKNILDNAKMSPLTTLYGGRYYSHINFVILNKDGTIGWRKYSKTGGDGMNLIYIKGYGKVVMSDFLRDPNKYLKQLK
jgi:hypothetical protein